MIIKIAVNHRKYIPELKVFFNGFWYIRPSIKDMIEIYNDLRQALRVFTKENLSDKNAEILAEKIKQLLAYYATVNNFNMDTDEIKDFEVSISFDFTEKYEYGRSIYYFSKSETKVIQ